MQMPPSSAPFDAAHAAQHDDHERDQHEVEAYGRKHREQRRHDAGGETDQRGAGGEGDEEDARNRNAHELRRLAVLDGGADRLAEVGRLQHEAQPERAGDRDGEADQQFGLGIEWAEGERTPSEDRRHILEVGRQRHERDVLHQDRQSHGRKHDHQVRLVERRHDDQAVHHDPEQEHGRHDRHDGIVWVEAEIPRHRPGAVHRDHQEFAVGEIDDAQHAENQRQPDAHQGIDAADEQAGKDELADGGHGPVGDPRCATSECRVVPRGSAPGCHVSAGSSSAAAP